jgi:hypothetical protein
MFSNDSVAGSYDQIACVDDLGRAQFKDLLFRRRECLFFAFDLLFVNGEDLREQPLIQRKQRLKKLIRRTDSRVVYVDHMRKCASWIWRESCQSARCRRIVQVIVPRAIGSRSRILTTRRRKDERSCLKWRIPSCGSQCLKLPASRL